VSGKAGAVQLKELVMPQLKIILMWLKIKQTERQGQHFNLKDYYYDKP
jgi:hypothetical protein